jgi:anti-sigma B factor antagonist
MALDGPLKIDREAGKAPSTRIVRLTGPLTLRNVFDLQAQMRAEEPATITILDLTGVPYMDSAGMGVVVNYHVHCQNRGGKFVAAGVSPRILELFKITKVDAVIRMAANSEEAEAIA